MDIILDDYSDKSVLNSVLGNLFLYELYYQRFWSQNVEGVVNKILNIS